MTHSELTITLILFALNSKITLAWHSVESQLSDFHLFVFHMQLSAHILNILQYFPPVPLLSFISVCCPICLYSSPCCAMSRTSGKIISPAWQRRCIRSQTIGLVALWHQKQLYPSIGESRYTGSRCWPVPLSFKCWAGDWSAYLLIGACKGITAGRA